MQIISDTTFSLQDTSLTIFSEDRTNYLEFFLEKNRNFML